MKQSHALSGDNIIEAIDRMGFAEYAVLMRRYRKRLKDVWFPNRIACADSCCSLAITLSTTVGGVAMEAASRNVYIHSLVDPPLCVSEHERVLV